MQACWSNNQQESRWSSAPLRGGPRQTAAHHDVHARAIPKLLQQLHSRGASHASMRGKSAQPQERSSTAAACTQALLLSSLCCSARATAASATTCTLVTMCAHLVSGVEAGRATANNTKVRPSAGGGSSGGKGARTQWAHQRTAQPGQHAWRDDQRSRVPRAVATRGV